mmetsp:Transcript_20692/g.57747  ORF Transcript_20692/g.57747 Transcript_20692/m.57747 type:complete len:268 (+) Transcript_20692:1368-2171(+)
MVSLPKISAINFAASRCVRSDLGRRLIASAATSTQRWPRCGSSLPGNTKRQSTARLLSTAAGSQGSARCLNAFSAFWRVAAMLQDPLESCGGSSAADSTSMARRLRGNASEHPGTSSADSEYVQVEVEPNGTCERRFCCGDGICRRLSRTLQPVSITEGGSFATAHEDTTGKSLSRQSCVTLLHGNSTSSAKALSLEPPARLERRLASEHGSPPLVLKSGEATAQKPPSMPSASLGCGTPCSAAPRSPSSSFCLSWSLLWRPRSCLS